MNVEKNTSKGKGHITDWVLDLRRLWDTLSSEDGAGKMQNTPDVLKSAQRRETQFYKRKLDKMESLQIQKIQKQLTNSNANFRFKNYNYLN